MSPAFSPVTLADQARELTRRWFWLPGLIGVILVAAWAWAVGWPAPVVSVDLTQTLVDAAPPLPDGALSLQQTFAPRHNGLTEVEILVVRYEGVEPAAEAELTLELRQTDGLIVAAQSYRVTALTHNQALTLRFPPQPDSAESPYTLRLRGFRNNAVTAWGYDLDVYADGDLRVVNGPSTPVADLRFITRYRLTPLAALRELGPLARAHGPATLLALGYLALPGCLGLRLLGRRTAGWDPAARWGVALAFGAAGWPLAWYWLTLAGGQWSRGLLWGVLGVGWLALGVSGWIRPKSPPAVPFHPQHLLLCASLLVGLAVRWLAVRDLAALPWVDASRHALITAIMTQRGQMITNYQPWLPVDRFEYHAGFHTLPAGLLTLTSWPLPGVLLSLGQMLNALAPLTVYAAAWLLTRRRGVGIAAAFLVALPFFLPAYYVSWARLTQLTGMLILPILVGLTWQLVTAAAPPADRRRLALGLGWLVAGLFFVHVRVCLLYLPFVGLAWLLGRSRVTWTLLGAGGVVLGLTAPRLIELARLAPTAALFDVAAGYNDFPTAYVTVGWERVFLALALLSLPVAARARLRGARWAAAPLVLAAWIGLLFLALNGGWLGLPETWLVNVNSLYITLFFPVAVMLGVAARQLWRWLASRHWLTQALAYALAGGFVLALILFGLRFQVTIVNPDTILTQPEDLPAIAWVATHTPPDARLAVNAWRWLGSTWAAQDGGAWLLPLTGRAVTTPPIDHIYNLSLFREVIAFNEAAQQIKDWSAVDSAEFLRQQHVTHIFVGKRGGFFNPAALSRNPALVTLYSRDGVFVFGVSPP